MGHNLVLAAVGAWIWGQATTWLKAMWHAVRDGFRAFVAWLWNLCIEAFQTQIVDRFGLEDEFQDLVQDFDSIADYFWCANYWFPIDMAVVFFVIYISFLSVLGALSLIKKIPFF